MLKLLKKLQPKISTHFLFQYCKDQLFRIPMGEKQILVSCKEIGGPLKRVQKDPNEEIVVPYSRFRLQK